ncbi:MAG: SCE4755 family polysaccharide monooxygenase-like protein [Kofleriaceae bacterium]
MHRLLLGIGAVVLMATPAVAHIHLTSPLARTDSSTGDQKSEHCGVTGQTRNPARVTTFRPGETITVTWLETINHPGHFRIAFQADGDVFGIPAAGDGPPAGFPSVDQTGMTDAAGAIILKDFVPDGTLSAQVTLPDIECENCTLQFIQVMTDKPPYTVDEASDDIYFNCADIRLSSTAPTVDAGAMSGGGGETTGGCASSYPGGIGGLLGLALVRRRRRSPA